MYPNITLKIVNHVPQIIFNPEKGVERIIAEAQSSLADLLFSIVDILELESEMSPKFEVADILALADEGNEELVEKPTAKYINYSGSIDFSSLVKSELDLAIKNKSDFSEYGEIKADVFAALKTFQNIDILASMLDIIYDFLVVKILSELEDLKVSNLKLQDDSGYFRLAQKLAIEAANKGVELKIED